MSVTPSMKEPDMLLRIFQAWEPSSSLSLFLSRSLDALKMKIYRFLLGMLHTALDSLILYRELQSVPAVSLGSFSFAWHFVSVSTKTESLQHGLDAVQPWSEWDRISLIIGSATKGFPKDFSWNGSQVFLCLSFLPLSSLSFLGLASRIFLWRKRMQWQKP